MDLKSRLRSIVSGEPHPAARTPDTAPIRELTYEPEDGYRQAAPLDLDRVANALGGRRLSTRFGECLAIDRRYESERWHGDVQIGDCELDDVTGLTVLDPPLAASLHAASARPRTIFIDLETTGLSGGAGTLAFLVGCGYFDLGAFQVRQFLLPSHSAERALLAAVAAFFEDADLIVTYNGKTFDVPVMETRWAFHRIEMPLDEVPHFDMLHTARRLWKHRPASLEKGFGSSSESGRSRRSPGETLFRRCDDGCRLSTLERVLFDVRRVGDVPGDEIPSRFYRFVRTGDARPLEPVLEHNRIDLVSLAAVTARAARLARQGHDECRDCSEALALGRVYERAEHFTKAEACYRRAAESQDLPVRADALYRLAVRLRRERRFAEAATFWRELVELTEPRSRRTGAVGDLRRIAVEALAIHQEHRARDFAGAHDLASAALEGAGTRATDVRHRLARLERKMARQSAQLFG